VCLQGVGPFSDEAAASIATSLAALTNLEEISLWPKAPHGRILSTTASYHGAVTIATALSKLPKLQQVSLQLPDLSDIEAETIMQIFKKSPSFGHAVEMCVDICRDEQYGGWEGQDDDSDESEDGSEDEDDSDGDSEEDVHDL
jgi:hypothetical protein